jgi:type VI secretion system secreted protein VgrG
MPNYTQADRPLAVATPLGQDALLLVGFAAEESISRLFNFYLDLIAENETDVSFEKLIGQPVNVRLATENGRFRCFSGLCKRLIKGHRDNTFTSYRMELVPEFWLLTRTAQSRIFQHVSVPDILKKVLTGLNVTFQLHGTFHPRDFCVQYRETDFNFASRLMEEEGIFYFFKHTPNGHSMVVANTPESHQDMPEMSQVIFEGVEGGVRDEMRILEWERIQELRSTKYTLWDHCFELPHKHLEAEEPILPEVQMGTISHRLNVSSDGILEIYDYPGGYAQRFDGINRGGGEQPADLQNIFEDNKRTVNIRMQQEALLSLTVQGAGNCRNFVSGYKFTLDRHPDANGQYLLVSASHSARLPADYRSGEGEFFYSNHFTCIPFEVPYRPLMLTPKPVVHGTQTAVVVGPAGEEIFVDKYGRVKVQFHWDRDSKADADSSCWIRVAQSWASKKWGSIFIPRIGMEVIVDFLEGDPDQPIVIGCVYNADTMPPYKLPDEKTKMAIKSYSTPGGGGFNEIRFEDKKGEEQIFVHGEKDQDVRIKNDRREWIGRDRHLVIERDKRESVERDEQIIIKRDLVSQYGRDYHLAIKGKQAIKITGSRSLEVNGNASEKYSQNHAEEAGQEIHLKAGMKIIIEAGMQISLKVGGNFVDIGPAGVTIVGTMVNINSGGAAGSGSGVNMVAPIAPAEADIADDADPGSEVMTYRDQRQAQTPSQLAALDAPWHDPNTEENKQKKSWIEIKLVDETNKPVPGERYRVTLPDGTTLAEGTLDENGFARVDGIDPGTCKVTFPDLDQTAWRRK